MTTPTLPKALETLTLLPDWESRYTYIIELAKVLPPMPEAEKTPTNLVRGCTSQVWLTHHWQDERLQLHLASDALIVSGLLALAYLAYNDKTAAEIATLNLAQQLASSQLLDHLSPNRRNGFASVLAKLAEIGKKGPRGGE